MKIAEYVLALASWISPPKRSKTSSVAPRPSSRKSLPTQGAAIIAPESVGAALSRLQRSATTLQADLVDKLCENFSRAVVELAGSHQCSEDITHCDCGFAHHIRLLIDSSCMLMEAFEAATADMAEREASIAVLWGEFLTKSKVYFELGRNMEAVLQLGVRMVHMTPEQLTEFEATLRNLGRSIDSIHGPLN